MRLPLLPEEVEVIQATCKVANLRRISSQSQVEEPFRQINERKRMVLQRLVGRDLASYAKFHKQLRDWLERVTGSNRRGRDRDQVASEVAPLLRDTLKVQPVLEGGEFRYDYWFNKAEGGCALALALLLGRQLNITNRLQQCGWSKCLRFIFDSHPKRRPRRFCNEAHARWFDNEGSAERQRRHRRKMKQMGSLRRNENTLRR